MIDYFYLTFSPMNLSLLPFFMLVRITSPLLLIAVVASAGVGYLLYLRHKEGMKVNILGKELPLGQQYALVAICSLPIFYAAGAGAALFWVFGELKYCLYSMYTFHSLVTFYIISVYICSIRCIIFPDWPSCGILQHRCSSCRSRR